METCEAPVPGPPAAAERALNDTARRIGKLSLDPPYADNADVGPAEIESSSCSLPLDQWGERGPTVKECGSVGYPAESPRSDASKLEAADRHFVRNPDSHVMTGSPTHSSTATDLSNTEGVVVDQGTSPSPHTDTRFDYGSKHNSLRAQEKGIPNVATITPAMSGLGPSNPQDGNPRPRLQL